MKKIIKNSIQCKHCGEIIVSKNCLDWVQCKCGACFVDGGMDYLRRGYKTTPEEDYIELSEFEETPEEDSGFEKD